MIFSNGNFVLYHRQFIENVLEISAGIQNGTMKCVVDYNRSPRESGDDLQSVVYRLTVKRPLVHEAVTHETKK